MTGLIERPGSVEPEQPKHAFVDAYGDPGLDIDKNATTAFFIVAAVLVDGERVGEVYAAVEAIRRKHFQKGPIKSSAVGENDKRRLRVLADLMALPVRFAAVALDKQRLMKDGEFLYPGLRFKGSFVKFVHSQLFDRMYERHPGLQVLADGTGREEFMEEFRRYVLGGVSGRQGDLFAKPGFAFERSTNHVLIQVADFIAGSLARIYDHKKFSSRAEEIHRALQPNALYVTDWPKRFRNPPPLKRLDSEHDEKVRRYCLERVQDFIAEHLDSEDPDVKARTAALEFLLFRYEWAGEDAWTPTGSLQDYLAEICVEPHSAHNIRSKMIAPLRDVGVILASSNRGYKVPASINDVVQFVERTDSVVVPMLRRVDTARQAIKELTGGFDILSQERFAALREALDGRVFGQGSLT
ncbi:DUF3800 domain-containing protein [Anaeromyxobacter dehalogenans]|uniref:DUF3800 domain-containing protein n=1 Tax=Anaeromyxobacter dehalogenans (strain 2CP-C) TaxID=290397 RepID=Q2IIY9_ANADE|nr:DUF3800 domain-containing protein [Anaeromyxobacter dehalogenans]ABC81622.1 hypothetical protein Adeh_1850 [Anaeromyxobacter dehalogenans 2CP-C]